MKSFDEACAATFLRRMKPGEDPQSAADDIDSDRWISLHHEVQNSQQVHIFSSYLCTCCVQQGIPLQAVIALAFSHGVMVGIEMEKQEEPK